MSSADARGDVERAVLASLDALVIDDLTDEEYDRFLAALAE